MTLLAKHNNNVFRTKNPTLFYKIHSIPEEMQTNDKWFDCMKDLCVPYDPLTLLTLVHPEMFKTSSTLGAGAGSTFFIGMTPDRPGVPNPDKVRKYIHTYVVEACKHISGNI